MHKAKIDSLLSEFTRITGTGNMRASAALLPVIIKTLVEMIEFHAPVTYIDATDEDAVATRLNAAPERRVFYADPGDLSLDEAKARIAQATAAMEAARTAETIHPEEAIKQARGTLVTELPEGKELEGLGDLKYFEEKLRSGLMIPENYLGDQTKQPVNVTITEEAGAALAEQGIDAVGEIEQAVSDATNGEGYANIAIEQSPASAEEPKGKKPRGKKV